MAIYACQLSFNSVCCNSLLFNKPLSVFGMPASKLGSLSSACWEFVLPGQQESGPDILSVDLALSHLCIWLKVSLTRRSGALSGSVTIVNLVDRFKITIFTGHCSELHIYIYIYDKLIQANKCLYVIRTLRLEGYHQREVDYLFQSIVLPNRYGLSVYGSSAGLKPT